MLTLECIIVLSITALVKHVTAEDPCPPPEEIGLCHCYTSRNIQCVGNSINSVDLLSNLKKTGFATLYINNTTITQINDNFLGESLWEKIIIANNSLLTTIGQNAFGDGPKQTLWIENCPKLSAESLLNSLKSVANSESIIIDGVSIPSLPANFFNASSKVKNILLKHNNISEISPNVFIGLNNLILVNLDHNFLHTISDGVINFTPVSETRSITVSMRNNKLTDNSFTSNTFKVIEDISIELHLEDNDLTLLNESIFSAFLENRINKLFLDNNDFHCNCNMLWLLNKPFSENVRDVACIDHKKNLFEISSDELCPTTTTTTSTTSTTASPSTSITINTETITDTITPVTTITTMDATEQSTITHTTLSTTSTTKAPVITTTTLKTLTTTEIIKVKCPAIVYPCDCDEVTQWFRCNGPLINDSIISSIGPKIRTYSPQKFDLITISNTNIIRLSAYSLINANYTSVYIEDNNDLIDIESEAFIVSQIVSLKVRRNRKLIDIEIYDLAKRLSPIELDFGYNSIEELPELAFVYEEMQYNFRLTRITLDNNKLTVISSNAFKALYNLTYLSLKNNFVTVIEDSGLKFDTKDNRFLTIMLTNNSLSSQQITSRSISLSADISLRLDLQTNNLTTLKQNIFEHFFINNESELNVNGNRFICTCDMKWILNTTVSDRIYNVYCANHYGFIFDLNVTEFCA